MSKTFDLILQTQDQSLFLVYFIIVGNIFFSERFITLF